MNAVASGSGTVGDYASPPSPTGWATWSGTSFAAARVSAAIADGHGISDVAIGTDIGRC